MKIALSACVGCHKIGEMRLIATPTPSTAVNEVGELPLFAQIIFQSADSSGLEPLLAALAERHPQLVCFCEPHSELIHDLLDGSLFGADDDECLTTFHTGSITADTMDEFFGVHMPMVSENIYVVAIQIGEGDLAAELEKQPQLNSNAETGCCYRKELPPVTQREDCWDGR